MKKKQTNQTKTNDDCKEISVVEDKHEFNVEIDESPQKDGHSRVLLEDKLIIVPVDNAFKIENEKKIMDHNTGTWNLDTKGELVLELRKLNSLIVHVVVTDSIEKYIDGNDDRHTSLLYNPLLYDFGPGSYMYDGSKEILAIQCLQKNKVNMNAFSYGINGFLSSLGKMCNHTLCNAEDRTGIYESMKLIFDNSELNIDECDFEEMITMANILSSSGCYISESINVFALYPPKSTMYSIGESDDDIPGISSDSKKKKKSSKDKSKKKKNKKGKKK